MMATLRETRREIRRRRRCCPVLSRSANGDMIEPNADGHALGAANARPQGEVRGQVAPRPHGQSSDSDPKGDLDGRRSTHGVAARPGTAIRPDSADGAESSTPIGRRDSWQTRDRRLGSTAVPALPLVGQLLLALFLMAGGARLYRRRNG